MGNFDDRIVRVTLEIRGQQNVYEGLAIVASGTKTDNPTQNDCTVKIANLSKDVRDYIVTETSPFNKNRTPKKILVEVGRVSTGTFVLFQGDITSATVSQPPDIWLEMKCLTGDFQKGNIISRSAPSKTNLSALARQVANDLGLSLNFTATDKQISSYTFAGGALNQVGKLAEAGNVNAFIDDSALVVKDRNVSIPNTIRVIDANSGMVGLPQFDEKGIKVTYLIDNTSKLGGSLRVVSAINPAANGDYVIYKLGFNVASRDTPFYYTAEATRV
jgi:hypothetical protein